MFRLLSSVLVVAILLGSCASGNRGADRPEDVVSRFYAALIENPGNHVGDTASVEPFLSLRMRTIVKDAHACQQDWMAQQPKGSTDKPPFVSCCLFVGSQDSWPTSFEVTATRPLDDGRFEVMVTIDFAGYGNETYRGRDVAIVTMEDGRYVVDDIRDEVDMPGEQDTFGPFPCCTGPRWTGGPRC